jgi:hypothetical protein
MKKKILFTCTLMSVIFMTFMSSRCSVIGLGVGASIDSSKPDWIWISGGQETNIQKGTRLSILLKNDSTLTGRYVETGRLSQEDYSEYYSAKQKMLTGEDHLPSIGKPIQCQIQIQPPMEYKGALLGFDKDCLEIQRSELPRVSRIPFKYLGGITDSNGRFIESFFIMKLIMFGQIPVLSTLTIENENGKIQMPLNEISDIKYRNKKGAIWGGLILGLIIDINMYLLISRELSGLGDLDLQFQ